VALLRRVEVPDSGAAPPPTVSATAALMEGVKRAGLASRPPPVGLAADRDHGARGDSVALIGSITLVPLFVLPATLAALSLGAVGTAAVAAYASGWALEISLQAHTFSGPGHGSGFASTVAVAAISTVAAHRRQRRKPP